MKNIVNIFFDLDGTIIDSSPGIFRCFRATLEELGLPERTDRELSEMIGPPLAYGMAKLISSADQELVDKAVAVYRTHYKAGGMFEVIMYDGIADSIRTIKNSGKQIYCVTGKAKIFAEQVLDKIGLLNCMSGVYGPDLDGRNSEKADLLRMLLDDERFVPEECVMIGDRKFDAEGANALNIRSVGVTWGFGTEEELLTAGAAFIIRKPEELLPLFL